MSTLSSRIRSEVPSQAIIVESRYGDSHPRVPYPPAHPRSLREDQTWTRLKSNRDSVLLLEKTVSRRLLYNNTMAGREGMVSGGHRLGIMRVDVEC